LKDMPLLKDAPRQETVEPAAPDARPAPSLAPTKAEVKSEVKPELAAMPRPEPAKVADVKAPGMNPPVQATEAPRPPEPVRAQSKPQTTPQPSAGADNADSAMQAIATASSDQMRISLPFAAPTPA